MQDVIRVARALADPIRLRLLELIAEREAGPDLERTCCPPATCVCELVAALGLGQSRVSYHMGLLRSAGLVTEERAGRWSVYRLNPAAVSDFCDKLQRRLGTVGRPAGDRGRSTEVDTCAG